MIDLKSIADHNRKNDKKNRTWVVVKYKSIRVVEPVDEMTAGGVIEYTASAGR